MEQSIYREQSLDRIAAPEETNQYLKKTGSGRWLAVAAVILLMMAAIFWTVTGRIESTISLDTSEESGQILAAFLYHC